MDECNMFNDNINDDLQYKELTLDGDLSEADTDQSVQTILEALTAAVDRIIRRRTTKNDE
jgi:hypothetical protein